jgi:hypothetical protein
MNHPNMSGSRFAATGAILLLLASQVTAQPAQQPADDTAVLREEVEHLQRALKSIQERLDAIEAGRVFESTTGNAAAGPSPTQPESRSADDSVTPVPVAAPTPQAAENWTALRRGMSPEQVKALLGDPSRNFKLSGQTVWYYHYTGVGSGSVVFSRGNGNLLDWQRPPFHGWW